MSEAIIDDFLAMTTIVGQDVDHCGISGARHLDQPVQHGRIGCHGPRLYATRRAQLPAVGAHCR